MRTIALLPYLLFVSSSFAQANGEEMLAGLSALRQDDHGRAEREFSAAVDRDPADARAWYYRAVNRLAVGNATGAKHDLDHLLRLEPGHAHAYLRRSEAHAQLGELRAAEHDLELLLRFHAEGPAAEHALLQLGHYAMLRGDVPAAHGHYDRLVRQSPKHAMARCNRGITHAAQGNDGQARADLEAAIAMDPKLDQAHANLGIVLLRMGELEQACTALGQALALGDHSVQEMLLIYCE